MGRAGLQESFCPLAAGQTAVGKGSRPPVVACEIPSLIGEPQEDSPLRIEEQQESVPIPWETQKWFPNQETPQS